MLLSYLRLLLFTFGLLAGVQVPGFIKDYSQRVEAHLIESQALDGFRQPPSVFQGRLAGAGAALPQPATTRCSTAMPTASKAC
jgi:hypothetical protein